MHQKVLACGKLPLPDKIWRILERAIAVNELVLTTCLNAYLVPSAIRQKVVLQQVNLSSQKKYIRYDQKYPVTSSAYVRYKDIY